MIREGKGQEKGTIQNSKELQRLVEQEADNAWGRTVRTQQEHSWAGTVESHEAQA